MLGSSGALWTVQGAGKLVIHRLKAINHGYNILFLLEYLFIYPQNIINYYCECGLRQWDGGAKT
jgi:hypothetical protein